MLELQSPARADLMVKNSRFLSEIFPVSTPEAARSLLIEQKKRHPEANHCVYAFIIGPQGNVMGCSDDGEPSGTAGKPTLAVLKGSNITNILLTTIRWFGGTKLGTGGLVHAYSASAQAVLELAQTIELIDWAFWEIELAYVHYESCRRILQESGFQAASEQFTDTVLLQGKIPASNELQTRKTLQELTAGKIKITAVESGV